MLLIGKIWWWYASGIKGTLITALVGVYNGTFILEIILQYVLKYKIHISFCLIVSLYLGTKDIDKNCSLKPYLELHNRNKPPVCQ